MVQPRLARIAPDSELPLPVGIVWCVIATKPPPQLGMRIISPIGSDRVGVRRIDGQLDNHSVGICDVKRRAVAMLKDKAVRLPIACSCEPLHDLVLGHGIAFERDMMKRGGRHLRSEEFLILGLLKLEEGQRTTVADSEETMTIGSYRSEELVGLAPSGNQRKAQQILVK